MTSDRLFTPRFFWMCAFTFTVFLSLFQLIPTAPFHVRDLGGGPLASGPLPRLSDVRIGLVRHPSPARSPTATDGGAR